MLAAGDAQTGPANAPFADPERWREIRRLSPEDVPDIAGPGNVSTAGNLWVKTTNMGIVGNPFLALSDDPAAQWPGPSGNEYLFFVGLWVGALDGSTLDLERQRRVSQNTEWRPPTLDPADAIYESAEAKPGGVRLFDDDGDGAIDEERLDGRDDDGDGLIDEDYAAISQQMYSCVFRDDTPEALEVATQEAHIPLGIEVHQNTYAFSVPGESDYTAFELTLVNVSGRELDSLFIAFEVDQDIGPKSNARFFEDDLPEPRVPQGPNPSIPIPDTLTIDPFQPNLPYVEFLDVTDPRYQAGATPPPMGCNGHCWRDITRVNGFSMIDGDGDDGNTLGVSTFLLLDHTIDSRSPRAPSRVGFRMYDYFLPGVPFSQGGPPSTDQERYELISSNRNIDPFSGFIDAPRPTKTGDYFSICSVGPFLDVQPGDTLSVTWGARGARGRSVVRARRPPSPLSRRHRDRNCRATQSEGRVRGHPRIRQHPTRPTLAAR